MDAFSVTAVLSCAALLATLARLTGHAHRGPFAYVLRRWVSDITPFSRAIGRTLYAAALALTAMLLAMSFWPDHATAIARWSAVVVGPFAAFAGALPIPWRQSRREV